MAIELGVLSGAPDADALHAHARMAEDLGFTRLAVTDHLDLSGSHAARLSWVPALASAAAVTSTLRFTPMVANQDLRNPAVLACDVSSLDRLSGGRMELGIGAGWNEEEYRWAGIPYGGPGQRITRLSEVVAAMRGLLRDEDTPFTLEGAQVRIDAMPRVPSVQQPLPIRLGGAQPRMLALAAREADIVNINTLRETGTTDEVLDAKLAMLDGYAGPLELSVVLVAVGDDPVQAVRTALPTNRFAQHVAEAHGAEGVEALARMPHVLAGSPAAIAEELIRRSEVFGITSTIVPAPSMPDMAPVLDLLR